MSPRHGVGRGAGVTHRGRGCVSTEPTSMRPTEHAIEACAALVVIRWPSKTRIARVNRRAAPQRQMRERWSTMIPQQTKQWIGVDLIAWTSQNATAVITAEVIAVRGDGAAVVDDVFPECAGVEDRVRDHRGTGIAPESSRCRRQSLPSRR